MDYYLTFLRRLKEKLPKGFERIEYVEQPTARDLEAHPENAMYEAARLCPVVIDESLIDVELVTPGPPVGLDGGRRQVPQRSDTHDHDCVCCGKAEDLPGRRRHELSRGRADPDGVPAARVPGLTSVEANARQFLPAANRDWEARFPGMFRTTDG